jgi:hypothetical protein
MWTIFRPTPALARKACGANGFRTPSSIRKPQVSDAALIEAFSNIWRTSGMCAFSSNGKAVWENSHLARSRLGLGTGHLKRVVIAGDKLCLEMCPVEYLNCPHAGNCPQRFLAGLSFKSCMLHLQGGRKENKNLQYSRLYQL